MYVTCSILVGFLRQNSVCLYIATHCHTHITCAHMHSTSSLLPTSVLQHACYYTCIVAVCCKAISELLLYTLLTVCFSANQWVIIRIAQEEHVPALFHIYSIAIWLACSIKIWHNMTSSYRCTSDLHWEQIRPAQFRSSPAGFFSALGPLRQQHHRQVCQLQCSDPQQPHSSPRVPADIYSRLYSLTDAFSGISRSKSVSLLYTDANLPPILQHAEFVVQPTVTAKSHWNVVSFPDPPHPAPSENWRGKNGRRV